MKVYFDTNVYVAEALLGETAEQIVDATERAAWRIFVSSYLVDELVRVIADKLGFSSRLAYLTRQKVLRRARLVDPASSRHRVPQDPNDSPILQAALHAGADYLVSNDSHLLRLNPYEGLRIVSMADYYQLLVEEGLFR
jgi:putative PIN family toxin of toxin-antitoxin system